ncbi:MAG: outer membrane beta-barrel protein [Saprospiraceae bacterium]
MKKLTFAVIMMILSITAINAQFEIEKVFGGANLGYAKPVGAFNDYAKSGITYNIEAGYKFTDHLFAGVEYNSVLTAALGSEDNLFLDSKLLGVEAYYLKGWYTPLTGKFKPYVALAVGLAHYSEGDYTDGNGNITTEGGKRLGLGGNLELGIALGGFNLSYSFNLSGKTAKEPVIYPDIESVNITYHRFAIGYLYNF